MLGRLIPKFILAASFFLAAALVALSIWTRNAPLVISSAGSGAYHEVRSGDGEFSFTILSPWTKDQRWQIARVGPPTNTSPTVMTSWQQMVLGDKQEFMLQPTARISWMPPIHMTGSASSIINVQSGTFALSGISTGAVALTGSISGASTTVNVPTIIQGPNGIKIYSGSTTMPTFLASATMPARLATGRAPAQQNLTIVSGSGGFGAGGFSSGGFGTTSRGSSRGGAATPYRTINLSGSRLWLAMTFDRYGVPQWLLIAIVLLPVWIKFGLILRRWRLRRWRRQFGLCEACGYDMRGNLSGACPECGYGAGAAALPPPIEPMRESLATTR